MKHIFLSINYRYNKLVILVFLGVMLLGGGGTVFCRDKKTLFLYSLFKVSGQISSYRISVILPNIRQDNRYQPFGYLSIYPFSGRTEIQYLDVDGCLTLQQGPDT